MADARTAQELAKLQESAANYAAWCDGYSAEAKEHGNDSSAMHYECMAFVLRQLAALASQAEPPMSFAARVIHAIETPHPIDADALARGVLRWAMPAQAEQSEPGTCSHEWRDFYTGPNRTHLICAKCEVKKSAEQSEDGRDAARWRELLRQHEIDDDQATHNNYGRTYPKRTLCVFQDDGEDGLEPVPCDPGELTRVVDAAIAAKEQQS